MDIPAPAGSADAYIFPNQPRTVLPRPGGRPGWADIGGRVSANNWVEVSSEQITGRWGS